MILDMFSELQKPEGMPEPQLFAEAIEQAKLADEMGFGCWWSVEHHGTGHFSYCSAPDMMLTAISQHTERIHLGHSGVLAPFNIHHPMQIAERAAFLDIMSHGRLELGLARSLPREWETFGVDPDETREQVDAALRMIPKMWRENAFSYEGKHLKIPERDVVPKPYPRRPSDRSHPPLWVTAANPEGFERAGRAGIGVLATVMLSPADHLAELFEHYQRGLDQCEPVGDFINDQRAIFTFFHCAETRQEAIDSGVGEAILWFMNMQHGVYSVPREPWLQSIREKSPIWSKMSEILEAALATERAKTSDTLPQDETDLDLDFDDPVPVISLMNRQLAGHELDPVEVYEALEPFDAVIVGDVEACRRKLECYAECGVDRLMCLMQMAPLPHETVMKSIRTTGKVLVQELAAFERGKRV